MRNGGVIYEKSYAFAIRIVKAYKFLCQERNEYVLSKQLLRCGTSIGANCAEAKNAQSTLDFINKLSIALKETEETKFWLNLLHDTDYIDDNVFNSIHDDCTELLRLLTAIIKSSKNNIKKE